MKLHQIPAVCVYLHPLLPVLEKPQGLPYVKQVLYRWAAFQLLLIAQVSYKVLTLHLLIMILSCFLSVDICCYDYCVEWSASGGGGGEGDREKYRHRSTIMYTPVVMLKKLKLLSSFLKKWCFHEICLYYCPCLKLSPKTNSHYE